MGAKKPKGPNTCSIDNMLNHTMSSNFKNFLVIKINCDYIECIRCKLDYYPHSNVVLFPFCRFVLSHEKFEDIKEVIRSRKSKKNRQHNGQEKGQKGILS
jgi:hypothetical protein